jgi:hypothetical protein
MNGVNFTYRNDEARLEVNLTPFFQFFCRFSGHVCLRPTNDPACMHPSSPAGRLLPQFPHGPIVAAAEGKRESGAKKRCRTN